MKPLKPFAFSMVSIVFVVFFLTPVNLAHETPLLVIVNSPELKKDLKLSDAEYKKFLSLFKNLQKFVSDSEKQISDMDPKDGKSTFQDMEKVFNKFFDQVRNENQKIRTELQSLLSQEQYEKFSMRVVQLYMDTSTGFMFAEFYDVLKLTDDQKQKMLDAYKKNFIDMARQDFENPDDTEAMAQLHEAQRKILETALTKEQLEKLTHLCKNLMPSYIRHFHFPEERTEYDSLSQSVASVPQAFRVAIQKDFLDSFSREAKLTPEETKQLLETIQKAGKKYQIIYYDLGVNNLSGMEEKEALMIYIRDAANIPRELNKELKTFLNENQSSRIQKRLVQVTGMEIIILCTFLWDEFQATDRNRKDALNYHYKITKATAKFNESVKEKSTREQIVLKRQYDEYCQKCMVEFNKGVTMSQQILVFQVIKDRPDYIVKYFKKSNPQK